MIEAQKKHGLSNSEDDRKRPGLRHRAWTTPVKHDKAAVIVILGGTDAGQDEALVRAEAAHGVAVGGCQVLKHLQRLLELPH
eukprot:scaffold664739_cov51-Prasinocladus_malaysianus.AAC.1